MPLKLYEKEQILDACFVVFARHGYANTTTAMLAEAAGVSKALIFHHFKNKKGLYLSILKRCVEKMSVEIDTNDQSISQDFFEASIKKGLQKFDYFQKNPEASKVMFEAFYATPDELKTEIDQFQADIEAKFGSLRTEKEQWRKQLFAKITLREGVDREHAFELIHITMDYFERNFLAQLTDENILNEAQWQHFFDKRESFLNMIRHGIEEKKD